MDNTDLNLWYRIGLSHSKLYQTDQAISAFLEVNKLHLFNLHGAKNLAS
jgi:hypothetical protein